MYTKKFINDAGDYHIIYTGGPKPQRINENQDLYVEWFKNNTPKEVLYVAPVMPSLSKSALLTEKIRLARKKTRQLFDDGFDFEGVNFSLRHEEKNELIQFALSVKADLITLPHVIDGLDNDLEVTSVNFNSLLSTGLGRHKAIKTENRQIIKDLKGFTKVQLLNWVDPR